MTVPENTSKRTPEHHLIGAFSPGYIEGMEAAGQQQLVKSSVLPAEVRHESKLIMEKWGFVFGDMVEGDDLFRHVTLPAGWTKEGSDHAMWSYVLDTDGNKRVGVFYKAAYYDRKAHMSLEPRFVTEPIRDTHRYVVRDVKTDTVLHTTADPDPTRSWEGYDEAADFLKEFLGGRNNVETWDEE